MIDKEYEKETLVITIEDGEAIVQLNNGKVNAINKKLTDDIQSTFKELDTDDNIKGAILTGRPHAFSAGLDFMTLGGSNDEEYKSFWYSYLGALQALVKFSKPLICAISGFAPAGGTTLALCSDYRIMGRGEKHVMGMHEFKMHMPIPELLGDIYSHYLGEAKAWKAVQMASHFNSDEAMAIGLVDESVEVEEVLPRAKAVLRSQTKVYGPSHAVTKRIMTKQLFDVVVNRDLDQLVNDSVEFNKDMEFKKKVAETMFNFKEKK